MQKFLVIQTAFIGDVVLATALLEKLHACFPEAHIDFLVRKGNEALLAGHPYLHETLVWDKKQNKLRNLWRMTRRIRREKYDKVINVQRFAATGILTAFSGAKETIGFDKNPLSRFFTRRIPHVISAPVEPGKIPQGHTVHEVERNEALLAAFVNDPDRPARPRLYPTAADELKVASYKDRAYITVSPASVWFTKQYPAEQWASFIRALTGAKVTATSAAATSGTSTSGTKPSAATTSAATTSAATTFGTTTSGTTTSATATSGTPTSGMSASGIAASGAATSGGNEAMPMTVYLLGAPGDRELCERIKAMAEGGENFKAMAAGGENIEAMAAGGGNIEAMTAGGENIEAMTAGGENIVSMAGSGRVVNLAGGLSFLQSAALMQDAIMNYVNDSAPMHFASALNAPVTAVYCSTIPGFGFGPLSDNSHVVQVEEPLSCRPCGLHGYKTCPQGHFNCAQHIHDHQLLQTLTGGDSPA